MEMSVVIVSCNRAELLRGALQSILPQAAAMGSAEIVVVDDGSTDNTAAMLAEMQQTSPVPFKVVQGNKKGIAAGRNLGCRRAAGRWIASFDDDQLALPGWLQALRALGETTKAACVGGELALRLPEGARVEQLGPRVRGILGEHVLGGEARQYRAETHPATNNALFRRSAFFAVGGYDESFLQGAEDKNFFERIKAAGYETWYQPEAKALHLIPARRLERGMIRWTAQRLGAGDGRTTQRKLPYAGPLRLAVKRLAVAGLRDLPLLLMAGLRRRERERLESWCSLWYTQGLLCSLPGVFFPERTSRFLNRMDFRKRNGERSEAARPGSGGAAG
jgi:GT2 family glycosyltransferase